MSFKEPDHQPSPCLRSEQQKSYHLNPKLDSTLNGAGGDHCGGRSGPLKYTLVTQKYYSKLRHSLPDLIKFCRTYQTTPPSWMNNSWKGISTLRLHGV